MANRPSFSILRPPRSSGCEPKCERTPPAKKTIQEKMEEEEGGFRVISDYICEHCKSPWIKQQAEGTCMACGKTGCRMPMTNDMGLTQEVDGITWNLQLTEKRNHM